MTIPTWGSRNRDECDRAVGGGRSATADDGSAMWRVDPDGSVHRTINGREWQQAGSVGAAEAIAASRNSAFIVTATGVRRLQVGG